MTYSIIGNGNMGYFLAKRLSAAGHRCAGIYGRDEERTQSLANEINTKAFDIKVAPPDEQADICFLAVSDGAIAQIAPLLQFEKTILVHTSGSVSLQAIATAAKHYGVFWPIYSILKHTIPNHRNIPCAYHCSSTTAQKHLLTVAHCLTDIVFEADDAKRQQLHLSAVISNNFINHLLAICERICTEQQMPFDVLQPIIEQTFDSINRESPYSIQTGPARRGDTITMQQHQNLLAQHPEWQQLYKVISASIENMYTSNAIKKEL